MSHRQNYYQSKPMIKATGTMNGEKILFLGLSFGNLDKFRAEPGDTFIKITGTEIGLPFNVLIFSGETEAHLYDIVKNAIMPDTVIHISEKLKS